MQGYEVVDFCTAAGNEPANNLVVRLRALLLLAVAVGGREASEFLADVVRKGEERRMEMGQGRENSMEGRDIDEVMMVARSLMGWL